jgi:hypothetical protein
MNAIELKAIVNDLIESYCDNVNGDFRNTMKEKDVDFVIETGYGMSSFRVRFWYDYAIDSSGCARQTSESFLLDASEKITMLEAYVNDALDCIYKAELIDERGDDPSVG